MKTTEKSISIIEEIILDKFKSEPFHNLYMLFRKKPSSLKYGGTCSDKTLSVMHELNKNGIESKLHTSLFKDQEIHRLLSLNINGEIYFADVGNGWPSTKLFPKNHEIAYEFCGIEFRTKVMNTKIQIFQKRRNFERLTIEIPFRTKPQKEILVAIENRADANIEYPFLTELRFSQIVEDNFLFLRGQTLQIFYKNGSHSDVTGITPEKAFDVIEEYFNFDIKSIGVTRTDFSKVGKNE
jgi:arylamine N-acetyltransferase